MRWTTLLGLVFLGCGSTPPPSDAPDAGAAPVPQEPPPRDASAPSAPASDSARPLSPMALADDALLGCAGDAHIDGGPFDVSESFSRALSLPALTSSPPMFVVTLDDGGYVTLARGFNDPEQLSAVRLGADLKEVARAPFGRAPLPNTSGVQRLVRLKDVAAVMRFGFTPGDPMFLVAGSFVKPGGTTEITEGPSFRGAPLSVGAITTDGTTLVAWLTTYSADPPRTSVYRRTLPGGDWLSTGLPSVPSAHWVEAAEPGKLRVYLGASEQTAVLATDGSVESLTPVSTVPATPGACESRTVVRPRQGFVTLRRLVSAGPCNQLSPQSPPSEMWLHIPADGPGRKLAEYPATDKDIPVDVDLTSPTPSVALRLVTGENRYTLRVQRLGASLEDVGRPLTIASDGLYPRRTLVPTVGGYMLLVTDILTNPGPPRTRAFRVVCG